MKCSYKNVQIGHLCFLLAIFFLLPGCGNDARQEREEQNVQATIDRRLDTANQLLFEGEVNKAIEMLEDLDIQHPNNPDILESLGFAYAKLPDHAEAAFHFDYVLRLDPSRIRLALSSAQAHIENREWALAADALNLYLKQNANDGAVWQKLYEVSDAAGRRQQALEALLQSIDKSGRNPSAAECQKAGAFFLALGNAVQAEKWFDAALLRETDGDAHALALLGLLKIEYDRKNWEKATAIVARLDAAAPGKLDQSELAAVRSELTNWQAAQEALETQIAVAENAARNLEQPAATGTPGTSDSETPSPAVASNNTNQAQPEAPAAPTAQAEPEQGVAVQTEAPAEPAEPAPTPTVVATVATNQPAPSPTPAQTETSQTALSSERATPAVNNAVTYPPQGDRTSIRSERGTVAFEQQQPAAQTPQPQPPTALAKARRLKEGRDYGSASDLYWQLVAEQPQNAELWNELADTLLMKGDFQNAEMAASEALRFGPGEVTYQIGYLKAVQKNRSPDRLFRELVRAKERFPDSPEITLALGQAYQHIKGNPGVAADLYQEFMQKWPFHPSRDNVAALLNQVR